AHSLLSGIVYTPWLEVVTHVKGNYLSSVILLRDEQIYDSSDVMYYGPWIKKPYDKCSDITDFIKLNSKYPDYSDFVLAAFIKENAEFFNGKDIPSAIDKVRELKDGITVDQIHSDI